MGRPYLRRRADSEKLYRHTAGNERIGGGLETISFLTIVKEDGIRLRAMCSVCLQAKNRVKALNSTTVHNLNLNSNVAPHTGLLQSLQRMPIFCDQRLFTESTAYYVRCISTLIEEIFRKIRMYTAI